MEKTLVDRGNGAMDVVEIPVVEMPTEVRKPGFKPEGRLLLCDEIPALPRKGVDSVKLTGPTGKVVENVEIKEVTKSGLLLPGTEDDLMLRAIVNAVGEDVRGYSVGDVVAFKPIKQAVGQVFIGGHTYLIMDQYNLLGKYEN